MLRCVEYRFRGASFDDPAVLHDQHLVAKPGHHAEIMRDDHDGGVFFQRSQEIQNLRLNGEVQRRGGLVGDQQVRLAKQCLGDHDPLPLATGKLVRIHVVALPRLGNLHDFEPFKRPGLRRWPAHSKMLAQHFAKLRANAHERSQRGHRVLEDHRHSPAPNAVEPSGGRIEDFLPAEPHAAACGGVAGQQAHQRHRGLRLARSRLAHDAEAVPGANLEINAFDRMHLAFMRLKAHIVSKKK